MLYAYDCQDGVSMMAGAGGASPSSYSAQACSRWLLGDSPSGSVDWATTAGAAGAPSRQAAPRPSPPTLAAPAAFALMTAGVALAGVANWLARPLVNGHVDDDAPKRATVVAGLYLGAAASTGIAWAVHVALASLQYSASGLASLMGSSPAAQAPPVEGGSAAVRSFATGACAHR